MAKVPLRIDSIFEGDSPSQYFGQKGQFLSSTAIDPDFPIDASGIKPSGFVVPIGYSKFSVSATSQDVMSIINTPKNTLTYCICVNGNLVSYDSTFTTETSIGTFAGSHASSGVYYNNYIYAFGTGASQDDVSRYGPLDGVPTIENAFWKTTLGKAALSNTTYPTIRNTLIPNHVGFVHGDDVLYFTDFESKTGGTAPGRGLLHRIKTRKVTSEGDSDDLVVPSSYNVLDLPFGFYPTAITNVSTNVMVVGIYSTSGTIEQGKAAFVLWDPTNTVSFFLGPVPLADPLATAALNVNGTVYIWTGNAQGGVRLVEHLGGQTVRDVCSMADSTPPFAGAVEAMGNRLAWGGFTTNPNSRGCVWAYGSKDLRLPAGVHNIVKTSTQGNNVVTTAIKKSQQDFKQQKLIVAWRTDSGHGVDKYDAAATLQTNIRWIFNIGQAFSITRIRIPVAGAVGVNTTITPKIYFDDFSSTPSNLLPTINNANYPSKRKVIYRGAQLKGYSGLNNFVLELIHTGTDPLPVGLPILIDIDVKEDETE